MAEYMGFILLAFYALVFITSANIQVPCCSKATTTCREACEKIPLLEIAFSSEEREKSMESLNYLCSDAPDYFSSCMNETLEAIHLGEGWYGRPCCKISKTWKCAQACLKAKNREEIISDCPYSDNVVLYACIEKQERSESCCRKATTSTCQESCREQFTSSLRGSQYIETPLREKCNNENQIVVECIKRYNKISIAPHPVKDVRCCNRSMNEECKTFCRKIMQSRIDEDRIWEELKPKCGMFLNHDRIWNCVFGGQDGNHLINSKAMMLIDAAKLQCCSIAFSSICHKHCNKAFSVESAMNIFDRRCRDKLEESDLIQCLAEIDEPCELGCQVLENCVNFNDRSTEFFRTCNKKADEMAEKNFLSWKTTLRFLGDGISIPILDISTCNSEVWKALACAQQLKPCQKLGEHTKKICRTDCESMLTQCVDRKRLTKGESPSKLCDHISPSSDDAPCISLKPYLHKSEYANMPVEVTHPCVPNPCSPSEVCMVNRNCQFGQRCYPSICVSGCIMGKKSRLVVPSGTYIRVPSDDNSGAEKCYQLSYCNPNGELEGNNRPSCIHNDDCWHNGKKITHNTQTKRGCDICVCYAGEITCTQMQCNSIGNRFQRVLPCNCPDHYVPVCGANGKTYPSACLARCESLTDEHFEFGACFDSDPCSPNSCQPEHRCVPRKRVCLSITHKSCKQYDCVNIQESCNKQEKVPVCDKDNIEHYNLCWMLQKGKSLGHYGKCMHHCRSYGHVCGHNGETYESECAAWAERVSVDYRGACVAVGAFDGSTTSRCNSVKCPPLPSEHCPQVYPPGGCCPVCGAALRLMYSRKLADWAVDAVRDVEPVVVQNIAEKLREHIKILECDVFAFLSVESIIALVLTITDHPTKIQIQACIKEAQKLELLIQKTSPTIITELPLSFITAATAIEPVNAACSLLSGQFTFIILLLTIFCMKLLRQL